MFASVRAELTSRLFRLNLYVSGINEGPPPDPVDPHAPDAKGLFFVYLYSIYERCVTDTCRAATAAVNAHSVKGDELRPELFSIALNDHFKSLEANPGAIEGGRWLKRRDLILRVFDQSIVSLPDLGVPFDGSHMRAAQLRTIFRIYGISEATDVVPDRRYLGKIDELVEHRNAIAHGRERPDDIGRRFTVSDLKTRVSEIEDCCSYFVGQIESQVNVRPNLCR